MSFYPILRGPAKQESPPPPPAPKKRRKTARACLHCQKAHLTCDEGRPCARCIKKNMGDQCVDGKRKQAKYLVGLPPTPPGQATQQKQQQQQQQQQAVQHGMGPPDTDFGSSAANLEYSILSNILGRGDTSSPPDFFPAQSPHMPSPMSIPGLHMEEEGSQTAGTPQGSPTDIYTSITKPYAYTTGFHALIAYLKSRFEKKELLDVVKSMAFYRPSFIATTQTLQYEDLVFMEKCFQRTLLEFEKYISLSGTPTVLWRRTGQIAAVGKEFCVLTMRSQADLLSQFIIECMDNKSVVQYFDVFSELAFEDSRGTITTTFGLTKPSGEVVNTACSLTIKRDVFDIPMMIVGNFLPIL
ncbi:transcription activator of gluconeogenesis ERT1-1 [Yarrowia lipolytica]|uniref:Transcription activator of gluconeogenesis ERT1-1 n=2 Tax=Yarrowia lipolytica TaxID=4952 RepID=ERT11_YARLI|nr:YALI0E18304p [Yarrowia lipolytica CLIB122]Q6C5G3.1 RecName: Full=Transcription activator of gluconeogenesis ERT1-1 [Yarrowia lipolytica CLIB122]RDW25307.1 transcription activator of gluconeogenesis ERT1-1 [Yarrowia lipolytica]RDW33237.1 transcription activator of gluconeogenesis ERT1-1 [Yarrowia lipolytica]CAG79694.1 YALI0E18304p [Yarrowia lipolytica CLIB122]|eukprot:XP_504099.1 YALI0E18304p [Yarrowia lipolytica CLIB122]